jgi:WD40 repeat protein
VGLPQSNLTRRGAELKVQDVETGQVLFTFQESRLLSLNNYPAFSPDGKHIAWGTSFPSERDDSGSAELRIWDVLAGKELLNIKTEAGSLMAVTFSPDSRRIAGTIWHSGTETQKVWDAVTGQELLTMEGKNNRKIVPVVGGRQDLVYSPDGTRLAAVEGYRPFEGDSEATVWDAATGRRLCTLKGHSGSIATLAFSPDGRRLATDAGMKQDLGHEVTIWDSSAGHELQTLRYSRHYSSTSLAFSPDGTRLYLLGRFFSGEGDVEVRVWDATPRPEK